MSEDVGGNAAEEEEEENSRSVKRSSSKALRRNTVALQGVQEALDRIGGQVLALTNAIVAMTEELRRAGGRKVVTDPVGSDVVSEMDVEQEIEG